MSDERVDCVAFTGSVETGKKIAARCAERVARMNLEMGGKDPFIVCADVARRRGGGRPRRRVGRVPERRPGVHVGRALLRAARGVRRLPVGVRRPHPDSLRVGDPLDPSTDVGPDGVGATSARRSAAQVEAAVAAGAELVTGRRSRRPATGPLLLPRGGHRRAARDRPAARGDLRPGGADRAGGLARRGDRAGQRHPLRPGRQRLHARPGDRRALHARDQGGHGVDQRPADRQRRRARSAASSSRAWAASWARRAWRRSRRPSTCTSRPRSARRSGGTRTGVASLRPRRARSASVNAVSSSSVPPPRGLDLEVREPAQGALEASRGRPCAPAPRPSSASTAAP